MDSPIGGSLRYFPLFPCIDSFAVPHILDGELVTTIHALARGAFLFFFYLQLL